MLEEEKKGKGLLLLFPSCPPPDLLLEDPVTTGSFLRLSISEREITTGASSLWENFVFVLETYQ